MVLEINDADVRLARRYCMLYGGDLAFINSTDTLNFIFTLPDYGGDCKWPGKQIVDKESAGSYTRMIRLHIFGLSFLVLCSRGLACNPGWTEYGGKCFMVSEINDADVRLARRYCMLYGGDLAFINSTDTLNFIFSLPNYDAHSGSYWIKEDSKLLTTPKPPTYNMCAFLRGQDIQYAQCHTTLPFICEVLNEDMRCPMAWYKYGNTCYKRVITAINYTESAFYCSTMHSHLAILDDLHKERQVSAVIFRQNETFFVGAKRMDGTFKWSNGNGKEFQPTCVDCVQHSNGDCLGYKSNPIHPLEFSWIYLDCSSFHPFICAMDATTTHSSTGMPFTVPPPNTTPVATTTTPGPLQCPIGYNWKAHEESGFCYWETTYEADKLNWHQAREFCKAYGGDLASYQNGAEEKHGLGGALGHYRGLWFGLERIQNNNFHWVDGSVLNYTNWESEPDLNSRSKFCGMHGQDDGKWELDYCGMRRWFICKSPMVRNPRLPDLDELFGKTPCHVSSPSIYRHRWFLFKDHCYMVNEEPAYSWGMAQNFCNDNEAHLASIHSFEETDFILLLSSLSSNTDYWIGLSSIGIGSSRSWSDNTPVDFVYWEDDAQVSNESGINSCVTFNKHRGFWENEHCNRFSGVICKRKYNSTFELPTPQPTPLLPGNCEKGWYGLGNQCYKTFGERWSQRLNWGEAKESCESIDASLVSIHSKEEQEFITDMLLDIGSDAWIGLLSLNRGTTYEWSDDTSLNYANWDVNEPAHSVDMDEDIYFGMSPSVSTNTCIKLSTDVEGIIGKWRDVACSFRNAYICQKPKRFSIYALTNTKVCRHYADCSFRIHDEYSFRKIKKKYQFYWTGIRSIGENEYGFLNGLRLQFSNWLPGQPQKVSTLMDNCIAMNLNTNWVVRNCKEKFPFVCQWNSGDKTEAVVERRHTCPNISDWVDIGTDTCYLFNLDSRVTWNDAMTYCFRHGGHLASLHSSKEAEVVRQHIVDNTAASLVHIGLGQRKDGSYAWVDHSPVNYVQWDEDEPDSEFEECVELFIRNGKWKSVDCDVSLRGFFCSSKRDTNIESSSRGSTHKDDIVNTKLAVGGFIGIAICVMVVFAIALVTAYYLCPVTRMRVKLLDSP
ncbi:hypothetical protein JTE90_021987 [Oedothorax gibbosus]|uniref:C-type lectin domain-containing protein n=1 Tax=Oedothorax gibbosus TaxID=931172 RepID=A0AAV6U6R3_9ARAC|nr:hypothetical protein JTE90_021987 [Oedothorax gibbosus]